MLKRYRSSPGPIAPCDPGAARQWPFGKLWPSCSPIRKDNWALCGFARNQRNYSCEPRCRRHHCRQYPVRRQPAPEFPLSVQRVLEDVSTRIIPEESPIDKTLRIKFMGPSFTFELLPSYMVEIAVGGN